MNGWGRDRAGMVAESPDQPRRDGRPARRSPAVRARAASGEERERLWARLADYPGWGNDLEALAGIPSAETGPPRRARASDSAGPGNERGAATEGRTSCGAREARERSSGIATRSTGRSRRPRPRHLWLVPGIGLALFANGQASQLERRTGSAPRVQHRSRPAEGSSGFAGPRCSRSTTRRTTPSLALGVLLRLVSDRDLAVRLRWRACVARPHRGRVGHRRPDQVHGGTRDHRIARLPPRSPRARARSGRRLVAMNDAFVFVAAGAPHGRHGQRPDGRLELRPSPAVPRPDTRLRAPGALDRPHSPRVASSTTGSPPPSRSRGSGRSDWLAHYSIGIAFAFLLLAIWGIAWVRSPAILPALTVGIGTIVAPWFVMQPAMGAGIAGSKTPSPRAARLRNLATHTVFGLGLYLSALGAVVGPRTLGRPGDGPWSRRPGAAPASVRFTRWRRWRRESGGR